MPDVISAVPNPCIGDSTTSVLLTIDPPIDVSGNYEVFFNSSETICENTYFLQSTAPFSVIDCPLNVDLILDGDIACMGDTTYLLAEVTGGDPNTYSFIWAPIFVPTDTNYTHIIPYGPTTYYVTVSDGTGASASDSLLVEPYNLPAIWGYDSTICQSDSAFFLMSFPTGGIWSGLGIHEDEEETGLYDPSLVNAPQDSIFYVDENGCENYAIINVIELDVGIADG